MNIRDVILNTKLPASNLVQENITNYYKISNLVCWGQISFNFAEVRGGDPRKWIENLFFNAHILICRSSNTEGVTLSNVKNIIDGVQRKYKKVHETSLPRSNLAMF